jgi:tetratricopeptide (TPR) repeat protein
VSNDSLAHDHPYLLASQHELARAYQTNGQVEQAVTLLQHVVKVRGDVLAEDHPDRLASQHELAGAYRANGQIEQADELLEVLDGTWNASM